MQNSFPERFNMADYFLYHNLEEGHENKVCLYFEDQKWTYGETARLSNQAGNALRELGVEILQGVRSLGLEAADVVGNRDGIPVLAESPKLFDLGFQFGDGLFKIEVTAHQIL